MEYMGPKGTFPLLGIRLLMPLTELLEVLNGPQLRVRGRSQQVHNGW